jgi:CelD/BcsL family acetyltransferase involved in cellulose biosynthesis
MRSAEGGTTVEAFESLDILPDDARPLFDAAENFFSTRAWWEVVLAHAIPPNASPRLLLIRQDGQPKALFPMLFNGGFRALTTPYTCLYEPLFAPGDTDRGLIFAAFARFCRTFATTRLDALDPAIAGEIAAGGRQAGLAVARFDHFGNWHEDVAGLDWTAWLARRPGALRETIRRRTRRAERLAEARFSLFHERSNIASGIAAFESVYARSWKDPEPYPAFNPAQIRAAASLGLARVGVWWIGDAPAAAQFWIVEHGRATVLKLAHDEAFKAHSPGTVLTAWMIRHMIERERVAAVDFGRGDDPYKQGWVADRGQRMGLMLINPRHPSGMIALARHTLGRIRARLRPDHGT